MKKANQPANNSPQAEKRPELIDFSERLRAVIEKLNIEKKAFALAGGITAQSLSGYLAAIREPGASSLAGWVHSFHINANWLLTGAGDMLGDIPAPQTTAPEQKEPTPLESEFKTFEAMMLKYDAPAEEIRKGLMARMGVAEGSGKSAEYGASKPQTTLDANHIHEDPAGFGKKA